MGQILLNILYTGKYISDSPKIGHEIINLFKDDHGRNYIYITPYGYISSKHNGQVDTVIMARSIGNGFVKVLAKADVRDRQITKVTTTIDKERAAISQKQREYITDNDVKYCGIPLDNIIDSANNDDDSLFITFECNDVRKPKVPIILAPENCNQDEDVISLPGINSLSNMSMKVYFSPDEKADAYNILQKIIDDSSLWETSNTTEKIDISAISQRDYSSFLSIIKKEDDELVFSNLFAYFFGEYPELFRKFAKTVLGLDIKSNNYTIEREKDNIDLLITDNENYIVIENKVKSKINGIRHDINGEGFQSQLKKYYDYAVKNSDSRKISCFIFTPNYNRIDLARFACGNEYMVVNYSQIYDFFAQNGNLAMYSKYYAEMLTALYPHTKEVYNDLENALKNRFAKAIRKTMDLS